MSFFTDWMTVFTVGLVAVISPGPDFTLTLRNSLAYSRRAGIYTVVGIAIGNIVHVTYCLVGIGAIIAQSIVLFNILKWISAAYLIYLGIKSLKAKKTSYEVKTLQPRKKLALWSAFRMGLLGNLLNPKATLFFLALFTQIIDPATPLKAQFVYGMTIVLTALVWFALVAIFISQRKIKQALQSVLHWIERLTGAVLIALGLRLAIARSHD
jgi:RhtB (resistance to homoserine/threonine) family protein